MRGLARVAEVAHLAVVDQHRPVAQALDRRHVVRDEHERLARAAASVEDVHAALAERGIADRQHLVDEHDVGVRLDHHGEREPDHHPRRVVLELEVGELAQLGEVEDRVEPPRRLVAPRAPSSRR